MGRLDRAYDWLRGSSPGLLPLGVLVGAGAGAGAVAFRYLIVGFTHLFTGRSDYSDAGRVGSPHFPGLGVFFVVLAPVLGGLVYGPLIERFAKEARGHGVPEVMLAVAERGGRIPAAVAVVKSLASALCIGSGGSVGREGPIVQIGSALGSSIGQVLRVPESRLRLLVACGAAGGISATFNAPIAGVFFGLELILRDFQADSFGVVVLSSVTADVIGRAAFGAHPFLTLPAFQLRSPLEYLFYVVLGLAATLVGVGFVRVLYGAEDLFDRFWPGPRWARPATGGVLLGLLLLGLPQLYGVGYPVLSGAVAGHYVLWLLVALLVGKIAATSLTIAIGGSGGVFAPSLFMGAMAGTAFGTVLHHVVPHLTGAPGAYGVIGMGAVFAGASRAPITAVLIIFELTGDYRVILPLMASIVIATALSSRLSAETIYTLKLRRRGIDILRGRETSLMEVIRVADAMTPVPEALAPDLALDAVIARLSDEARDALPVVDEAGTYRGAVTSREVEAAARENVLDATAADLAVATPTLRADQHLDEALGSLVDHDRTGLPVVSADGARLIGWVTHRDVLAAYAARIQHTVSEAAAQPDTVVPAESELTAPVRPGLARMEGYRVIDLRLATDAPPVGQAVGAANWPPASLLIAIRRDEEWITVSEATVLAQGDRLTLLVPAEHVDDLDVLVASGPSTDTGP
ncbi:MAG TPA: chloride channel protein [Acidimicrobiales bacterium]|nr:chloride channel protein [Acidimicrobiales bacterium]